METELVQLLGIGVGVCAVVALIVWAVRLSKATDAIWPTCARKYGLAFDEQKTGSALSSQRHVKSLTGTFQGVPLRVVSTWELVGNTRRTSTSFFARALHPSSSRFSLHIARAASGGPKHHLVPTGNPRFDQLFALRSDSPELVRALATGPVQSAIAQLPMDTVQLSYDAGELCLSYGERPFKLNELEGPIGVLLAASQTRFS